MTSTLLSSPLRVRFTDPTSADTGDQLSCMAQTLR